MWQAALRVEAPMDTAGKLRFCLGYICFSDLLESVSEDEGGVVCAILTPRY